MIKTFEDFESVIQELTPNKLKIDEDSWFHIEVQSVWKAKSIKVLFFKNRHTFLQHGETLEEVYMKIADSIREYYKNSPYGDGV